MRQLSSALTRQPSPDSPSPSPTPSGVNRRLIAQMVGTLLGHYWTPNDSPEVRALIAADWIADLEEFSAANVKSACEMWRRSESRRPTPSDIRKLCQEARHISQRPTALPSSSPARRPPDHVIRDNWRDLHVRDWTAFELQTANQELDSEAREHGFSDRFEYVKARLGRNIIPTRKIEAA